LLSYIFRYIYVISYFHFLSKLNNWEHDKYLGPNEIVIDTSDRDVFQLDTRVKNSTHQAPWENDWWFFMIFIVLTSWLVPSHFGFRN